MAPIKPSALAKAAPRVPTVVRTGVGTMLGTAERSEEGSKDGT